jgi:hypothetical protein
MSHRHQRIDGLFRPGERPRDRSLQVVEFLAVQEKIDDRSRRRRDRDAYLADIEPTPVLGVGCVARPWAIA